MGIEDIFKCHHPLVRSIYRYIAITGVYANVIHGDIKPHPSWRGKRLINISIGGIDEWNHTRPRYIHKEI